MTTVTNTDRNMARELALKLAASATLAKDLGLYGAEQQLNTMEVDLLRKIVDGDFDND